jgi:NAD(P)-dependent dehydrogenase (short-subunit alcohol dehydrogenase family)
MANRIAVITGASSGIGWAVARALGAAGWRLVLVGRNRDRLERAASALRAKGGDVEVVVADLTRIDEVHRAAAEIAGRHPAIDLLVNNAGAVFMRRATTSDGHERTFALNVIAPYLLARLLEPNLRAVGGGARVVDVASEAHRGAQLDLEDLESRPPYSGYRVYARSKVALILLNREFALRTPPSVVLHVSLHPGFVRTRFGRENGGAFALLIRLLSVFAISPERAARTVVYAATAPELAGTRGAYIVRERRTEPSHEAQDPAAGARLWAELARITGLPA